MRSNKELVNYLIDSGVLANKNLIRAFLDIDRKDFVPEEEKDFAYEDHALPIGFGQTISQPTTVAFALELLDPRKGDKVLDVGSGSGWTTALLASAVGKEGVVYGVELIPELVEFGKSNLTKYNFKNAQICKAKEGELGLKEYAPYDRILVSAEADKIPEELLAQLKDGGIMVIPVNRSLVRLFKQGGKIITEEFPGFVFVPLITNK